VSRSFILSTDTEIDTNYYRSLKPRLSGAASLEFDQRQELTTFPAGLFLGEKSMADRLYTSSEADEVLSALRFETKLEKAHLARIAFTLSLVKDGASVVLKPELQRRGTEAADVSW
jgi:hypothetical protein